MTKILIVDDQEDSLRYLETLLSNHDYEVDSARNGAEALERAQRSPPNLVISDLVMPLMDGYTLLRHWKADPALKSIPFIVHTATFTDADDQHFGQGLGADGYILKPTRVANLIGCVRQLLAKTTAATPLHSAESAVVEDEATLKYYNERLILKLEEKTRQLEWTNQALQRAIDEHQQAAEQIRFHNAILQTQQQNSLDAILVVGVDGKVLSYNNQMLKLWGLPQEMLETCREIPLLQSPPILAEIGRTVQDPDAYLAKVRHLYEHSDETSLDEVRFNNGKILEMYSAPAIGENGRHYGRIWYFRDVTEHQLLLQSLREKAMQLSNAQRLGRMGSWSSDLRTGRLMWTDATCELFGIRPEEFQGTYEHFKSFILPEDLHTFEAGFEHLSPANPMLEMQYRIRRPDGQVRWLYARGNVEFDAAGAAIVRAGTVMDITEQKQVNEQLAQNAALLRIAGRLSKVGGWSVDMRLPKVHWSDEVCVLHDVPEGYCPTLQEAMDFYPPEYRELVEAACLQCHDSGKPFDLELQLITARGRRIWVRVIGEAMGSLHDNTRLIQGAIQDISAQKDAEEQIHGLGARLRETLESISDGFFTLDHDWKFIYVSGRGEDLLQRKAHELIGRNIWDEFKEAAGTAFQHNYARAMTEQQSVTFEEYYPPLNAWFEISAYPTRDGLAVYFRNVTARKEMEAQLAYLHRVRAVLSGINALIVRTRNRDELFREACRIACVSGEFRMAMLCMVNPVTEQIEPVASEGKDDALMDLIKSTLATPDTAARTMVFRALQTQQPVVANESGQDPQVVFGDAYRALGVQSMAVLPLIVNGKSIGTLALYARELGFFQKDELSLLTGMTDDIAFAIDHIEKQERLDYLANFDTLTGLANRDLFLDRLRQRTSLAARNGDKQCIALINLARFKSINDTLGRGNGDTLLKLVAEWLIRNTGDADRLARLGADQFAAIFDVKPEGDLIRLFDTLNRTLEENRFAVNDTTLRVAARFGIAVFPDDGDDADALLRNAEAALKEARATNDRFVFYTPEMNVTAASRLAMENQLRQALSNEEFELYYQPKANLLTGKIVGAEALLRWNHPDGELVPPGKFIPVLEETGMIADVGNWALRKAIADHVRWLESGLPAVRIAVNVSPLQLNNYRFIEDLKQSLPPNLRAAGGLELEITESVIMEDIVGVTAILAEVRAMGITLAIDDFGTGFSSLGYLAKLPVDALKIDRSFIADMTSDPEGLALVSMIITLAHTLNLKVVAEGVETAEQMRLLRLLKCNEMQGCLLSPAVPAAEFERLFLQNDGVLTI